LYFILIPKTRARQCKKKVSTLAYCIGKKVLEVLNLGIED